MFIPGYCVSRGGPLLWGMSRGTWQITHIYGNTSLSRRMKSGECANGVLLWNGEEQFMVIFIQKQTIVFIIVIIIVVVAIIIIGTSEIGCVVKIS